MLLPGPEKMAPRGEKLSELSASHYFCDRQEGARQLNVALRHMRHTSSSLLYFFWLHRAPLVCVVLRALRGGTQRHEHIVFVGVSEEIGVLPLKALAQEMISRGYRASLALPQGFQSW